MPSYVAADVGVPEKALLPAGENVGTATNVRFAPDGSTLGFLFNENSNPYSSCLFITALDESGTLGRCKHIKKLDEGTMDAPVAFEFAGKDEAQIIIQREQQGHTVLACVNINDEAEPQIFFTGGSVTGFHPIHESHGEKVLVSSSVFIETSLWQVVDVKDGRSKVISSAFLEGRSKFHLTSEMITEFWYKGGNGVNIHSWMIVPPNFDKSSTYPLFLLPHGGPESAWNDSWSTRVS